MYTYSNTPTHPPTHMMLVQLVLAPTRELALQIYEESQAFCKHMKMRVYALVGGGGMKSIEEQGFQVRQVCFRHTSG
jgi:superfamily II DNA/RNA helicase